MYSPADYFDITRAPFPALYDDVENVWEALGLISRWITENLKPGKSRSARVMRGSFIGKGVSIGAGTIVEPGAVIIGPAIIGENCRISSGAYIRQDVIIGNGAVVGKSVEVKNSILHEEILVPHMSYVGDSLLGYKCHLGAGVKISNVKLDLTTISVQGADAERIDTGLLKFGAILGDYTEVGCNAVLNPGSMVGNHSIIYPLTSWRGYLPPNSIAKLKQETIVVERKH